MRVLDLFSGIGGFSLGLERAGYETVAFCEISPSCRHLLAHHWPEVPQYDDVTTLTADRLATDGVAPDVICAGFPCQDLSYAGLGAGLDGARSGLWFEIPRLLREFAAAGRPVRFVILENVAALLGRGLDVVLRDLAACGFDAEWDCIPASAVGAPHRRDRIWIVAYARGEQHEGFGDAFRRALAAELADAVADPSGDAGVAWGAGDAVEGSGGWDVDRGSVGANVAYAARQRQPEAGGFRRDEPEERTAAGSPALAYSTGEQLADGGSALAYALGHGCAGPGESVQSRDHQAICQGQTSDAFDDCFRDFWRAESDVGRVADGLPALLDHLHGHAPSWKNEPAIPRVALGIVSRVDRLHGLGNAVVPEIPYRLGLAIRAAIGDLT